MTIPASAGRRTCSVDTGDDPVLDPGLVLRPLLGTVLLLAVLVVVELTVGEQRDDAGEVGPRPQIGEVAEHQSDRQAKEPLAHVVEVAGRTPKAVAENLAVAGLDVLGLQEPQELAVGPALERVLLHVGATRDAPPEEEHRRSADQPHPPPETLETRVGVNSHTPQRHDIKPAVNDQTTPEQLETDVLMDQVVGVELHPLKHEIVEHIEREKPGIQVDTGIGVVTELPIVPHRTRQAVQREHRPAHNIEIHLHVEPPFEELDLLSPPEPPRQEPVLDLALRIAEHPDRGHDDRQDRPTRDRIHRRPVEPVTGQAPDLESPHRDRHGEHQDAVQPIRARLTRLDIDDITRDLPTRQNKLHHEERDEHEQRGEEPPHRLRCRQLE